MILGYHGLGLDFGLDDEMGEMGEMSFDDDDVRLNYSLNENLRIWM